MDNQAFTLSDVERNFILHWGEMGSRWGVNRTVAQIHALLYLAPRPLHAEEIADTLSLARSTVSTSLRELQSWGIVRLVHVLGDRRDHFETVEDVWEMFRILLAERKRREIDPTLEILRESVELSREQDPEGGKGHSYNRLKEMLEVFEAATSVYEQTQKLPIRVIKRLVRSGESVSELVAEQETDRS